MVCSSGLVTVVSTFSGLAPTYCVMMTTYGSSMGGSRSVDRFINDTTPKINTRMTATTTVYGFLTLILASIR